MKSFSLSSFKRVSFFLLPVATMLAGLALWGSVFWRLSRPSDLPRYVDWDLPGMPGDQETYLQPSCWGPVLQHETRIYQLCKDRFDQFLFFSEIDVQTGQGSGWVLSSKAEETRLFRHVMGLAPSATGDFALLLADDFQEIHVYHLKPDHEFVRLGSIDTPKRSFEDPIGLAWNGAAIEVVLDALGSLEKWRCETAAGQPQCAPRPVALPADVTGDKFGVGMTAFWTGQKWTYHVLHYVPSGLPDGPAFKSRVVSFSDGEESVREIQTLEGPQTSRHFAGESHVFPFFMEDTLRWDGTRWAKLNLPVSVRQRLATKDATSLWPQQRLSYQKGRWLWLTGVNDTAQTGLALWADVQRTWIGEHAMGFQNGGTIVRLADAVSETKGEIVHWDVGLPHVFPDPDSGYWAIQSDAFVHIGENWLRDDRQQGMSRICAWLRHLMTERATYPKHRTELGLRIGLAFLAPIALALLWLATRRKAGVVSAAVAILSGLYLIFFLLNVRDLVFYIAVL